MRNSTLSDERLLTNLAVSLIHLEKLMPEPLQALACTESRRIQAHVVNLPENMLQS